ncbi:MAG: hypothetical protein P4L51_23885 [Puia sp.]|nr:hypothetical protein [Puia sp.]
MAKTNFSAAQLKILNELAEILKKCQSADIHITGVTEYEISQFKDANGKPYVGIS